MATRAGARSRRDGQIVDGTGPMIRAPEPIEQAIGAYSCSVYTFKTVDGATASLTRLPAPRSGTNTAKATICMVAGSYSNRSFWISPKGLGLGPYLHKAGFDVWLLEPRGHGQARRGDHGGSAEAMAQYDVSAAQDVMRDVLGEQHKSFWLGHSAGGIFVAMALAVGWLSTDHVAGAVLMGTETTVGYAYLRNPCTSPVVRLVFRILGGIPANKLGWGPERESTLYLDDFSRWLIRGWESRQGSSVATGLSQLKIPVLCVTTAGDTVNPAAGCERLFAQIGSSDKELKLFSRANGHSSDFTHVGMVISKEAVVDIHPYIERWLHSRL